MRPVGRYGHHRDEDAPTTVTVLRVRRGVRFEEEVPVPASVLRLRRQINDLASRGYVR